MNSNNPFLRKSLYTHLERDVTGHQIMTANGAANKAALLIVIVFVGALFGWVSAVSGSSGLGIICGIVGFILALVTMFNPHIAGVTAPIYAICEGIFLGGIAVYFEQLYPGIASQAVIGTIGVFMIMMILYRTEIIRVTDRLRSIVISMMMGIVATYFISFILSIFTGYSVFAVGGTFGIIFSLLVIGVAAFSLLLDFDSIERAESMRQPKNMEWFYAFSLLITLVWLYLEILRLLSYIRRND